MRKRTFNYKLTAAGPVCLDSYMPEGGDWYPVVVFIHGGTLICGSRERVPAPYLDLCLQAGWGLVSIDYRLAPETKLPEIIQDVEDAFLWLAEHGPQCISVDTNRMAVLGRSAGGYLALIAGCRVTPRPAALVSLYGYGDICADWYAKPDAFYRQQPLISEDDARAVVGSTAISSDIAQPNRSCFCLYLRQQGRWLQEVAGYDPVSERETLDMYCPVHHVTSDYPPTLLIHGDADTAVPYAQSVEMARVLERAGVEHEFVTIPGGGHGFDRAALGSPDAERVYERVRAFLSPRLA